MTDEIKLCRNCRHARHNWFMGWEHARRTYCTTARMGHTDCGEQGEWYEPKKKCAKGVRT